MTNNLFKYLNIQVKGATFSRNPTDNNRQKEVFYWKYWQGRGVGQQSLERQPW